MRCFALGLVLLGCLIGSTTGAEDKPEWVQELTSRRSPGEFPPAPSMHMVYRFGWSGIPAARADVHFHATHSVYETDATGGTYGFPRTLFRLDVVHHSVTDRATLHPLHLFQEERYRSETVRTTVDYKPTELISLREVTPAKDPAKSRTFDLTPVFDMQSALLWLRSTPLQPGQRETLIVWPSNAPYLATVMVTGRERVRVAGEERPAIKLELQLKRIDKTLQLQEHKKFKSARGWLSDDDLRIPLRLEADIFIGYVYAELESSQPEGR
ncbi:MAG: DUF3108 domain-containing protein [Verrucomicrobia bacterium]|nr:DUF3108 domain-containing protein [Verrucomicrobiota bacterium]